VAGAKVGKERQRDGRSLGEDSAQSLPDDPDLLEEGKPGIYEDHLLLPDVAEAALSGHLQVEGLDADLDPEPTGELEKGRQNSLARLRTYAGPQVFRTIPSHLGSLGKTRWPF
jgi:hypothetical protein